MANETRDGQTNLSDAVPTDGSSAEVSQIILENVQQIQKIIQDLDEQFKKANLKLEHTDSSLASLTQKFSTFENQMNYFDTQIQNLHQSVDFLNTRFQKFDERFSFISNKFNTLTRQIDSLDTEFGSLKTMVLAAVDKAMKEYSNFVVEKLTLGSTIDVLRLEVDKMKNRIEKLEEETA